MISDKGLPQFLVRQLSLQQQLAILEDNFKNENEHHVKIGYFVMY